MKKILLYLIILPILLISCKSKYQQLLTGTDYNLKYETALKYYNEGDYYRAQQLLESIITIYRGTDKSENIVYYLAKCYYDQSDYMYAGYYYENFTSSFPASEKYEECLFMTAFCYYKESPKYSLDQEYTNKSLEKFDLFVRKFPESEKLEEANTYIGELNKKLKKKAYEIAVMYERIGDYKAAILALKNCIYDYPDIDNRETLMYLIVKSSYELAERSVDIKKYERYESTIEEYFSYIDEYPNGKYLKNAEKMYALSKEYIDKF